MKLFDKINRFLTNLTTIKFIIVITSSMFLSSTILGIVIDLFGITSPDTDSFISKSALTSQFILAVVIAPILETFLFQNCIIKFLRKIELIRQNDLIIILLSAFLFGLLHYYDLGYIINTTVLGIFLSYTFVTFEKKNISPFFVTCIIHSFKNFISFIIVLVLEIF